MYQLLTPMGKYVPVETRPASAPPGIFGELDTTMFMTLFNQSSWHWRFLPVLGGEGSNPLTRGVLHAEEDLVPCLVIPYVIDEAPFLLDNVLDPTSLFDEVHKRLVGNDSCEGLVLWCSCCCHYDKTIGSGLGHVNKKKERPEDLSLCCNEI
jgi:hypothetical protein